MLPVRVDVVRLVDLVERGGEHREAERRAASRGSPRARRPNARARRGRRTRRRGPLFRMSQCSASICSGVARAGARASRGLRNSPAVPAALQPSPENQR